MLEKGSNKPRGFGFVTFHVEETIDLVLDDKDNHFIMGKWIDCKRATPKNTGRKVTAPK